jgi:uncharacterized metal-binding protein
MKCDECKKFSCVFEGTRNLLETCWMVTHDEIIVKAKEKYDDPMTREMTRNASIVEARGYLQWPRLRDTVEFMRLMKYKKVGLATCIGLINEAKEISKILHGKGFEVTTAMCKVGSLKKTDTGVEDEFTQSSKTGYLIGAISCNPVAQALLLNEAKTEFNLIIGLCVGHDATFTRYSEAPVSTLIAKDRVLNHNPASILYTYYGKKYMEKVE